MQIDGLDLRILRAIEWGGITAYNSALHALSADRDDIQQRLERLGAGGPLQGLKGTLFVPPLLGGEWTWGCILLQTAQPQFVATEVRRRLPFVSEILFNTALPSRIGYTLSVLFYASDLREVQKYLSTLPQIDYVEVYEISHHSFPLPRVLSDDERNLIRIILRAPEASLEKLAQMAGKSTTWMQTRLEAIVWDPNTPKGLVLAIPEINWRSIENFAHVHFLVESSLSPESVSAQLKELGLVPMLGGRRYRDRFLIYEADLWGFSELHNKHSAICNIQGITLSGMLMADRNQVVTDWVVGLLER